MDWKTQFNYTWPDFNPDKYLTIQIKADFMKLFYRKYGTGDPVIILHGLFGVSDNWVTHARRLAEKFEVFVPDQRNHGQSPHSVDFNYRVLASDLLEFMHQHSLEKAHLIGHSMGGKVAMTFALEHPYMVRKLVVIDISPRSYTHSQVHQDILHSMSAADLSVTKSRDEIENILQKHISSSRIRMMVLKNLHRAANGTFSWRVNVVGLRNNIHEITAAIAGEGAFPGPVLFIRGGSSEYITDDDEELIVKYFPNAYIHTIANASHWLHADAPDELCRLFSSFLGKECVFGN